MDINGLLSIPSLRANKMSRQWAPVILLTLSMIALFVFQNRNAGFEANHHGNLSSHGMTIAKNLMSAPGAPFMYERKTLTNDGRVEYKPYNRFPVVPFLLIGVAIWPFEPRLATQIFVARQLMNGFVLLSALLCFLLVCELIQDRYRALLVTLAVFSTHYLLYYGDMIFNDVPAVAGFVLAAWLAVRSQKRSLSTGALIGLSAISVATGWQVFAVYSSWLLVDLARSVHNKSFSLRTAIRRPAVVAIVSASTCGAAILIAQLLVEWSVMGGRFSDLGTVKSMLWRFGVGAAPNYSPYTAVLTWSFFTMQQAIRMARAVLPFTDALSGLLSSKTWVVIGATGMFALIAIAAARREYRGRARAVVREHATSLVVLVLSGLVWSFPMKYFVVFHDFQAMFYIGLSIALFTLLAVAYPLRARFAVPVAMTLLVLSVHRINVQKSSEMTRLNAVTADFQAIYERLPLNSAVFVDVDSVKLDVGYCSVDFYLAGDYRASLKAAQYVVSEHPDYPGRRLTANSGINLFRQQSADSTVPSFEYP
jgi:hypothetical protein